MPGVPSSRGCEACMKQKKKCDRAIPVCARCSRLGISCFGAGTQRYKYLRIEGRRAEGKTSLVTFHTAAPSRPPINGTARLISQLLKQLSFEDVRYDVCYAYGPLLLEVPKRLGESKLLDRSVKTLVLTVQDLGTAQRSRERLMSYGHSLKELRTALQDPKQATSSLTLCAIFVIWICQGWIGGDQSECQGHGAGLVRLLAMSSIRDSGDAFERQLLPTLLAPVIFERAFDPSIRLEPWMQEAVIGKSTGDINALTCFLHLPELLQFNPLALPKCLRYYESMRNRSFQALEDLNTKQRLPFLALRDIAKACASLAMSSGLALLLNEVIQMYKPDCGDLVCESLQLYQSILDVASQVPKLLPLSASWLPLSIELAWVSTTDRARRTTLEQTWDRYWKEVSDAPFGVSKTFLASFESLRADASASLHPLARKEECYR